MLAGDQRKEKLSVSYNSLSALIHKKVKAKQLGHCKLYGLDIIAIEKKDYTLLHSLMEFISGG